MLRQYKISFSYFSSNRIFYLKIKKYCLYVTESNTCTVHINNGISNIEGGGWGLGGFLVILP